MKKYILLSICIVALLSSCTKESASLNSAVSGNSTSGSMARFTLAGNYLYTVNSTNLKTYDVSNPAAPVLESTVGIGSNIETVFAFKGSLFIGSSQSMYLYSLANPAKPVRQSQANYVRIGCDPVVANDSMAYSTVRNLNGFGGTLNMINIKNPLAATITSQLFLTTNPYGLGMADTALYICQHSAGLQVYNLAGAGVFRPLAVKAINDGETYYDVIPFGNLLYAWIEGGNSIYNISNRMNPTLLSKTKN
jgi:hypothetical protein